MSTQNHTSQPVIDFRTMAANVPTLCIPRVYPNITESRIRKIFNELDMGIIDRVDIVNKNNKIGDKFNRVFIHFRKWSDSPNANTSRELLLNGKEIKIIYDDPWFWKISAYREPQAPPPRHTLGEKHSTPRYKKPEFVFNQLAENTGFVRVEKREPKPPHTPHEPRPPRPFYTNKNKPQNNRQKQYVPRSPSSSPPRYPTPETHREIKPIDFRIAFHQNQVTSPQSEKKDDAEAEANATSTSEQGSNQNL